MLGAAAIKAAALVILLTMASDAGRGGEAFLITMARAIAHVVGAELAEELIKRRVWLAVDVRDEQVV